MKGLLLKDFYSLKRYTKTFAAMLVLYTAIGASSTSPSFITGMIVLVVTLLTITTYSYDEAAHFTQYSLSFPISRKKIMLSKYILSLILTAIGGAMSILITGAIALLKGGYTFTEILVTTAGVCMVALLMISVMLPMMAKFGVEKARIMLVAVFLIPFGIVMLLNYLGVPMPNEAQLTFLIKLAPLIVVGIMVLSYLISCKIIAQKEY